MADTCSIYTITIVNIICICIIGIGIISTYKTKIYKHQISTYVNDAQYPITTFVSKSYFTDIVHQSSYFDALHTVDLYARQSKSIDEYKNRYIQSFKEPSQIERQKVIECIQNANDVLQSTFPILYVIPWNIAFVSDDIENGYPHTHGDVIVLNSKVVDTNNTNTLMKTLIHEKVHVLQRSNPDWCESILSEWGFSKRPIPNIYTDIYVRSNPDLDGNHYEKHGYIFVQIYGSNTPSSLADSIPTYIDITQNAIIPSYKNKILNTIPHYVHQLEHPYELMASIIPMVVTGTTPTTEMERILIKYISIPRYTYT